MKKPLTKCQECQKALTSCRELLEKDRSSAKAASYDGLARYVRSLEREFAGYVRAAYGLAGDEGYPGTLEEFLAEDGQKDLPSGVLAFVREQP